jgi:hypothetical protein
MELLGQCGERVYAEFDLSFDRHRAARKRGTASIPVHSAEGARRGAEGRAAATMEE